MMHVNLKRSLWLWLWLWSCLLCVEGSMIGLAQKEEKETKQRELIAEDTCMDPRSNKYWNTALYPEFASRIRCSSAERCEGYEDSCCLAEFCLCGRFVPAEKGFTCLPPQPQQPQPPTPLPTPRPTTRDSTPAPTPGFETCSRRGTFPFWNKLNYPQYADEARCFFSEECTEKYPNGCCLAQTCLCGLYNSRTSQCVPFISDILASSTSTTRNDNESNNQPKPTPTPTPATLSPIFQKPPTPSPTLTPTIRPTPISTLRQRRTPSPTHTVTPRSTPPVVPPSTPATNTNTGPSSSSSSSSSPRYDTCVLREEFPYWNTQSYPEYASSQKCYFSEECPRYNSYACCLAEFCLCGYFFDKTKDCVPYL